MSEQSTFVVTTSQGHYDVRIGTGIVATDIGTGRFRAVIADQRFADRFSDVALVPVEAAEAQKSLATVERVIVALADLGVRRDDHVLAVGGGVIQDVATLAASLFMRGISWTYAPTTLMSMTDSCIGGKSSINAGQVKNLVGNIFPPSGVLVDPEFTRTLDDVDLVAGLAEAAKICFCRGPEVFDAYLACAPVPVTAEANFVPVIDQALRAKQWFIEIDEFDRSERKLLNFGHTFGHALEAATEFRVPHGIGVALGMLAACRFVAGTEPEAGGGIGTMEALERHIIELLGVLATLPALVADVDWARFGSSFALDKKHGAHAYRVVLPSPSGGVVLTDLPVDATSVGKVETAMRNALDLVHRSTS